MVEFLKETSCDISSLAPLEVTKCLCTVSKIPVLMTNDMENCQFSRYDKKVTVLTSVLLTSNWYLISTVLLGFQRV